MYCQAEWWLLNVPKRRSVTKDSFFSNFMSWTEIYFLKLLLIIMVLSRISNWNTIWISRVQWVHVNVSFEIPKVLRQFLYIGDMIKVLFENWTSWVLYNEWLFAVYVALWSFGILKFRFLLLRVFPKQWPFSSNAIGNIQFTSGTTGMPKAAALSHFNLINNGISVSMHCNRIVDNWNTDSIICNVLPLYHVFGFVAGSICGAIMNAPRNGISIR